MSDHYRMVRNKLLGQSLDDWSPRDLWVRNVVVIVTMILSVLSFQHQNGLGSTIIIAGGVLLYLLLMRLNYGNARVYEEVELFVRDNKYRANMKKRLVKHSRSARSDESNSQSWLPYEREDEYIPPIKQNVIEVLDEFGEMQRIPILSQLNPDSPYDHLYIRVKGGKFVDSEDADLKVAIDTLAGIVDTVLLQTELKAGIGSLYVRAPLDPYGDFRYYEERGNPLVVWPDEYEITDPAQQQLITRLRSSLDDFLPMVRAYGMSEDWSLFVVTIHRDKTTSSLLKGQNVSPDSVYNLPVLMLARDLVERLKASPILGYEDAYILREHELCMLVRQSWDIAGIDDFYAQIAPYHRLYDDGQLSEKDFADYLWSTVGCLPTTFRSLSPECIEADGNYTLLVRIDEMPEEVYPSVDNSLLRLGEVDVWLRNAVIGISSSAKVERARVYGQKASTANLFTALFSNLSVVPDIVETKRDELEQQSMQLRRVALVQRFARYSALVTTSQQRLVQGKTRYLGALKSYRYKPRVVKNTALHQEKWLAATLGIHS